ncbi:hypothetical protein Tco_1220628 [Tanacetum coccineum]
MGMEVRSVHPWVTEYPNSDIVKMEFKSLMMFRSNQLDDVSLADYLISESLSLNTSACMLLREQVGECSGSLKE